MKRIYLLFILVMASLWVCSQDMAIYTDYLNKVQLFDGGEFKELEHLPLKSYQIGNECLGYEDNSENFKIYYNHYTFKINSFVSNYIVTDHLVAYNLNNQLKVFDRGDNITLSVYTDLYAAGDELVAFFDKQYKIFKVYYNGEIIELDDALAGDEITEYTIGENSMVYLDSRDYYNIFYQGKVIEMMYKDRAKSYKAGRDVVAFVESPVDNFHVFYKGSFMELESFEPKAYKIGDGFVAYIDSNDYLKVYDGNGEVVTVSFDAPAMFEVEDELLIYTVQNYFKVYWNGQSYTLDSYIPDNYVYDGSVIAWENEQGNLNIFDRGQTAIISYEKLTSLSCHGATVSFSYGVKSHDIYWNGNVYAGE
ncbi:MAG: hypothetical protein ACP5DZ_04650 [Bacteroidales bacterium]